MDIQKIIGRHKQTVAQLLLHYTPKEPLHLYLKKYFAAHKKHGSKDRKYITTLLYSYFRLGKNIQALQKERSLSDLLDISCFITENIVIAGFMEHALRELTADKWLQSDDVPSDAVQRFHLISQAYPALQQALLFPFKVPLSEGLQRAAVEQRQLFQPDVFLRIREKTGGKPGSEAVIQQLRAAQIPYKLYAPDCISVAAGTPIQQYLEINRQVVIQDSSSQQMAQFMQTALQALGAPPSGKRPVAHAPLKIWDCCAASGGKSILVFDLASQLELPIKLMVTDVRASILKNLEMRFKQAGISNYHKQVVDLLSPAALPIQGDFDLIICDAPCSGSGTWARNPENIQYFKENSLDEYFQKQTGIARKAWSRLKPGGFFLYMTCSVFARENEQVSEFIAANSDMTIITQKVVTGFAQNQVSMFAALYTRKK